MPKPPPLDQSQRPVANSPALSSDVRCGSPNHRASPTSPMCLCLWLHILSHGGGRAADAKEVGEDDEVKMADLLKYNPSP
ncbi:hypothetical protein FKM82_020962 [Ascaphus truei]